MTEETTARQSVVTGPVPHQRATPQAQPTADRLPETPSEDHVRVRMPAESAYLSVLRTATAGLAARLDFTLDEIEDLRIAVDEACGMLFSQAVSGSDLECDFELDPDLMTVTLSVAAARPRLPARETFSWTVLSSLAGDVDSRLGPGDRVAIVMRKCRGTSGCG